MAHVIFLCSLPILVMVMVMGFIPGSQGTQGFRSFKRAVVDGFELSGPLMANRSVDGMTVTDCAMWCYQRKCPAYSFAKRGSVGVCKLGWNPYVKKPRKRAKIYHAFDDSDPMAYDGVDYTLFVYGHNDFRSARGFCSYWSKGEVPLIYPSEISYRAVRRLNTLASPERIFVDLHRVGDFSQRQFVSGQGEPMDASNVDRNVALHWATSRPTTNLSQAANAGNSVIMDLDTGLLEDAGDGSILAHVVCSNDTSSYRYLPASGKYYKFVKTPVTNVNANRTCQADGGRLAITYGANGSFPVLDFYSSAVFDKFWVGGSIAPGEQNIFVFQDGVRINSSNKAADVGRQRWYTGQPAGTLSSASCIFVYLGFWFNFDCAYPLVFLCERDYPWRNCIGRWKEKRDFRLDFESSGKSFLHQKESSRRLMVNSVV